jgi:hypothetical protein
MKKREQTLAGALGLLMSAGLVPAAMAQEPAAEATGAEKVESAQANAAASAAQTSAVTIALIQLMIKEGLISLDKAQALLDAAEREAASARSRMQPAASGTVRVPYVPESVKNQMREEVRKEIAEQAKAERWVAPGSVPAWVDRVEWSGDFRLRYHGDNLDGNNFPLLPDVQAINDDGGVTNAEGFPLVNTTQDRQRLRYRGRLNLAAKINPAVKVGFSLASGEDNGPVSTNKTFGDYLRKDAVWLDRAFIQARLMPGLELVGGRMANPFYSTELVWDTDLNPEGVALKGSLPLGDQDGGNSLFATAGAFPLQEFSRYSDRWLYAGQLGGNFRLGEANARIGLAYYDFQDVQSEKNAPDGSRLKDYTRPALLNQGNSVFNMRTDGLTTLAGLASEFRLVNVTAQVELPLEGGKVVRLTGDYVQNLGFDQDEINALRGEAGIQGGDTGWQVKVSGGDAKLAQRHDWDLALSFRRIESDAVLDVFNDSDFGVYGGTDLEGLVLEGNYGVSENTWVGLKWLSADAISRPPFASDVLLLDLNARF